MAGAEIMENLRRSFSTLLNVNSRLVASKMSVNSRSICFKSPSSRCSALAAGISAERPGVPARGGGGQNVGVPLNASYQLLKPTPGLPGAHYRGMASKAHMKYAKRKKAPIDRFKTLDPAQPKLGFDRVEELDSANDTVKKLFSLEFATGTDLHKIRRKITEDSVRDKPDEKDDLPVKIATITEHIKAVAAHLENNKKDSVNKVRMLNAIDRRRKMLKYLRKRDYERFQRLLDELNLTWTPPPEYYRQKTRRAMEKKAVVKEGFARRQQALQEFEETRRAEMILEIAKLKEELGKELEEEEREALERSRQEN